MDIITLVGKNGQMSVLRPKFAAAAGIVNPVVADALKFSGKNGEKQSRRLYFACEQKLSKFKPECKTAVSCLASLFHPNQESLSLDVG
jgi:hypothetical protein